MKLGGGDAGHNGLRSITAHLGKDCLRVRLGIGHPGHKALVQRHVLSDFAKADAEWLEPFLEAIAEHAPLVAAGEDSTFMNRVALATGASSAKEERKAKGQSHVPQARAAAKKPTPPRSGPMADILRKLFGGK